MGDDARHPRRESVLEPDPRFPSGPWTGFWLQRRMPGRNWMRDLVLRFTDGQVEGGGIDCVGKFSVDGIYDLTNGRVKLVKRYVGAHAILYEGQNDDDGRWLWGVWTLRERTGTDRGGFHMWPRGQQDPTHRRVSAEREMETPETEPVPA